MSSLHIFAGVTKVLAPTRDDLRAEQQGGVSLWYIATRAGVSNRSGNWVLNYVRLLVANERFPAPFPYFGLNARRRTGINLHSRWSRSAVDAWFDGFLPPALITVAEGAREIRDAHLLDARAATIAGSPV